MRRFVAYIYMVKRPYQGARNVGTIDDSRKTKKRSQYVGRTCFRGTLYAEHGSARRVAVVALEQRTARSTRV